MEKLVTINKVISLLTEHDCITSLMTSEDEKAKGFLLALQSGVDTYDLRNSSDTGVKQQLLLSHMVNVGAVNDAFRVAVVAEANPAPQPEPEPTPPECTAKRVKWNQGRHIVVELLEPLSKPVSVTTWLVQDGFKDENLGRSIMVDEALKYRIDMSGKQIAGDIEVRVCKNNVNFNVEVI